MVVFIIIIPIEILVGTNQQPYYLMIRILAVCRIFDHILNQVSSCVILIDMFFLTIDGVCSNQFRLWYLNNCTCSYKFYVSKM